MKTTLLTIVLFLAAFSSWAQLENTVWKKSGEAVYGQAKNGVASFYNGSYSESMSATYSNNYTIDGDILSLTDPGFLCGSSGVGKYKFSIVNDILKYTLISDACAFRAGQINNTTWGKYNPLGVAEDYPAAIVRMYPNPTNGVVNIELPASGKIVLYNANGLVVAESELLALSNSLDVKFLGKGLYHAQIFVNSKMVKSSSLVVE